MDSVRSSFGHASAAFGLRQRLPIAATVVICALGSLVPRAASGQAGVEPPSAAAIKAIIAKASAGHPPTSAEASAVDRFAHAAASGDVSARDFAEAFSPLLSSAPADVRAIINRARQGGTVGPAQVWKVAGAAADIGQGHGVSVSASGGVSASGAGSGGGSAGAGGASAEDAGGDHDPSRLELIAKVLHTDVCPGPAPKDAAAVLGAAPPSGVALTTLLDRIAKAALEHETAAARPHLTQVFATSVPREAPGLGAALWLHGSSNAAVYVFAEIARRTPTAASLTNLGAALNSLGAYPFAFQVLGTALRLDSKSVAARNNLAIAKANLGDLRGAESDLQTVTARLPQSVGARFGLGRVVECEGDVARALPILQAAVASEPGSREAEFVDVLANGDEAAADRARTNAYIENPGPPGAIFGSDRAVSSIGNGALLRPEVPSSDAEWIATFEPSGGPLPAIAAQFSAQSLHYHDIESRLERLEDQEEKHAWVHARGDEMILISDRPTLHALDYAEKRAADRAAKASSEFLDGMKRLEGIFKDAEARFEANPRVPPCSIFGPASDEEYQTFAGLYRTEYTQVNAASMDYAATVRRLVARLHDPYRAAREEASALGTITSFNASVYQDVLAFAPYVAQSVYGKCRADGSAKRGKAPPKDDKDPTPGPCATYFDRSFVIVSMKATCHTLEISGGEGVLAELKLDTQTHSGTVFLGVGLSASAPNDPASLASNAGPIGEVIGKAAANPVGGSLSFEGSIGMVLTVDGSGDVTDGGFRFGAKYEAGGRSADLTTTVTVQNGMQFSSGFHSLDWIVGK